MTQHLHWSLFAAIGLSVAPAACSTTRFGGGEAESHGPTTANGVEQFPVPQDGRSLLAQRLVQLVPGRITDARISNAWRTAAAAQVKPNDYAARSEERRVGKECR